MKRQIISFAAMCALTVTLHAQTAYLSEIAINNRHIEKNAARQVEVSFEVDLSQLDIKRQHSLQLVPVIVSADRSQEAALPPIIINGKVRDRVQNREAALDKTELNPEAAATIRRKNGSTQTYDYRASVPFKQWMIGGELEIRGYATGCAQCDEGNETNYTGEILPPMTPAYARPFMEPKEETVKRRAETKVARLQFRQDSHTIDPKYKGNRNELDSIRRSLNIVNDNNDLDITGIYVTGYASPEGTFPYNMQLSERRAKAFARYLEKDLKNIPAELYHVAWKGEDWVELRKQVEKFPNLLKQDEVLDIIDHCGDDTDACEEQIKALIPPEIYQRVLNEMYPAIRRNEYRIEYNVRHFDLKEGKQMIKTRPDLMSVSEMQRVADSYGKGTPQYTDCLLTAARTYPDNVTAVNNAALALIEAGRAQEAVNMLEKAPRDGALLNMLGTAYAETGQTERAMETFRRAADAGYAPAADNAALLQKYTEYMAE